MDGIDVSILICSYVDDPHLLKCLNSIEETVKTFKYEILIDIEDPKTLIHNTPIRYNDLFRKSKGDYIVKSDSDILYFPGWLEEAIALVNRDLFSYVGVLDPRVTEPLGYKNKDIPGPIYLDREVKYDRTLTFISGACWVFKRSLWERVPYPSIKITRFLDSAYGNMVCRMTNKCPGYTQNVLCSHMGVHV